MNNNPENFSNKKNIKNKIIWSVLFLVIAAATIWTVVSQSKIFSLGAFSDFIKNSSWGWLAGAFLCMLGFIFFEGAAITSLTKGIGYKCRQKHGFVYSAADIYFSAITPSASGGQPASVYFMVKDGIPLMSSTLVLLTNLILYTVSIILIGLLAVIFDFDIFFKFDTVSKILIIVGYIFQIILLIFFILLLARPKILHTVGNKLIGLLGKMKLLRHKDKKLKKLDDMMEEYSMCYKVIRENPKVITKAMIYNFLQRICVISVSALTFLAIGGNLHDMMSVWIVQCFVVIGSNAIPIPGAMGASDYIMLDGFSKIVPYRQAVNFELLSRSISFYSCVILCGVVVLLRYISQKRRKV